MLTEAEEIELLELLEAEEAYSIALNWKSGDLTFKLHSGQVEIIKLIDSSVEREFLLFISRQWGKSFLVLCIALMYCIKHPNSIVRIAAPTLKQAGDIVNDNLMQIIADAPPGLIRPMKSQNRWQVGGSQLRIGVLERAHVDSLRGGNAKLIIAEEGGFVSSDDYEYALQSVIGPQLLRSKGKLFHVTTPSEDPLHYIHTEIIPRTKLMGTYFERDIYSNPQLSPEQIKAAMDLCGGEDTSSWKREYLVRILRDQGSIVVPEFDETIHVQEFELPPFAYWQTVIDMGGVRDKTYSYIQFYDFLNNRKCIWDERVFDPNTDTGVIVASTLHMESLIPWAKERHRRVADVAGQTRVDMESLHSFTIIPPVKDEWKAAINQLKVSVKRNEWLIHPRCTFIITSLNAGMFNKQKTDFARTKALGHCDAIATMMYGNRVINTDDNPYPAIEVDRNNQIDLRRESSEIAKIAQALRPKRSGYKRK